MKNLEFLKTSNGNNHGKYLSPYFSADETPNRHWMMQMNDISSNLIQICVFHYSPVLKQFIRLERDETVLIEFAIIDNRGDKVHQQMKSSRSCVEFQLSTQEVLNCERADGSFIFYCAVQTFVKKEDISRKTITVDVTQPRTKQQINCSDQLANQFEELFHNMKYSDVNFDVLGRQFQAHKNILTSRSEVFAAMFEHPTQEKLSSQVIIEDIEPNIFHELLLFIYSGRIPWLKMKTMSIQLFIAADKYMIDGLKDACENHIISHMSPEKCLELLSLTPKHPAEHLKKNAISFFRLHPVQVMATDGWAKAKREVNLPWICDTVEILLQDDGDVASEQLPAKKSRLD